MKTERIRKKVISGENRQVEEEMVKVDSQDENILISSSLLIQFFAYESAIERHSSILFLICSLA